MMKKNSKLTLINDLNFIYIFLNKLNYFQVKSPLFKFDFILFFI